MDEDKIILNKSKMFFSKGRMILNKNKMVLAGVLCLLSSVPAACGRDADVYPAPGPLEQAERQIEEQSFEVELDGWGQVMFAPFMREKGENDTGQAQGDRDVQFKLLKGGETVYTFPARYAEDILQGQSFEEVASVSFYDYNEDGRKDILLLIKYTSADSGMDVIFYEPRLYTQEEGKAEFYMDVSPMGQLSDYKDSIDDMKKGLEVYGRRYAAATGRSAWEVERFARRVKRLFLAGDFEGLAKDMVFPVRIDGTVYIDKAAYMKAEFVTDPNPAFMQALREEPCAGLFCNYSGIMMGNGLCWILDEGGQGLKVYAVNGITPEKK